DFERKLREQSAPPPEQQPSAPSEGVSAETQRATYAASMQPGLTVSEPGSRPPIAGQPSGTGVQSQPVPPGSASGRFATMVLQTPYSGGVAAPPAAPLSAPSLPSTSPAQRPQGTPKPGKPGVNPMVIWGS